MPSALRLPSLPRLALEDRDTRSVRERRSPLPRRRLRRSRQSRRSKLRLPATACSQRAWPCRWPCIAKSPSMRRRRLQKTRMQWRRVASCPTAYRESEGASLSAAGPAPTAAFRHRIRALGFPLRVVLRHVPRRQAVVHRSSCPARGSDGFKRRACAGEFHALSASSDRSAPRADHRTVHLEAGIFLLRQRTTTIATLRSSRTVAAMSGVQSRDDHNECTGAKLDDVSC